MGASRMTRRSTWAKRWGKSWGDSWGLVDQEPPVDAAAAGSTKSRRRPLRVGTPWHWMPPPAPLRRTRRRREAELLAFLRP